MIFDIVANSGVNVPPAEPAATPEYKEVARAVNGTVKNSSEKQIPRTVGRLVKRTGADTTLKNAGRDGAQFAWVPAGDTCAFCLTLASRGWQYMSKNALRNGHAEHIHPNCDCQYAIRFDDKTNIAGYDPDKYLELYENAEGDTPQEKINSMRRMQNAEKKQELIVAKKTNDNKEYDLRNIIKDFIEGNNADRKKLAESILKEYNVTGVQVNIRPMIDRGNCELAIDNNLMKVDSLNLQSNDERAVEYQVKTAFHEAFHASSNGYPTDFLIMDQDKWNTIEEVFAESSAFYVASLYGIKDLSPSYPSELVSLLPRLKQLPEFSKCKTIVDFGKIAQDARQAGTGSVWKDVSSRAMRKKYNYSEYVKQYFNEIRSNTVDYIDKYVENIPIAGSQKEQCIDVLNKAMDNIEKYGFTLSKDERNILTNAIAIAMNRIGVF